MKVDGTYKLLIILMSSVIIYLIFFNDSSDYSSNEKHVTELLGDSKTKSESNRAYDPIASEIDSVKNKAPANKTIVDPKKLQNRPKQQHKYSKQQSKDNLDDVLANTPMNYHPIFQWHTDFDEEFVNEVTLNNLQQEELGEDLDLENALLEFIYQNQDSKYIQVDRLTCTSVSCEVFGIESRSGLWSTIVVTGPSKTWWPFTRETTRSSVGTNGEMIFYSILKK